MHYLRKLSILAAVAGALSVSGCNILPSMPSIFKSEPNEGEFTSVISLPENSRTAPRGLNAQNLFSENIKSDDARLDRLENAVQDIRNELSGVRPSIDRLVEIESDIRALIRQLEDVASEASFEQEIQTQAAANQAMVNANAAPMPQMAAPSQITPAPQIARPKAPIAPASKSIVSVRKGEYAAKTRLVLDNSGKSAFKADIDNGENILIIEISDSAWTAPTNQSYKNSQFINGYTVEPLSNGGGVMMIVSLKKNAKIGYQKALNALSGSGQRIVIDLVNP